MKKLTLHRASLQYAPLRVQIRIRTELRNLGFGSLPSNQRGFIPMLLCIIGVIALIIFLVYTRVARVNH